ncbi:hypothetical protein K458DRAFT_28092 [Lentithecium fluviatile CBS 122367]|uniref:Uncharacterized protein n=1 Tax=Lentithecium fluviatile CBS 122367 TaxID=1168545 RepID=A0A6G1J3X7_9PLEO|nr:hypothetical protein K458DRAFT_28092 [Lentithecium fluviatile CBS 122367]
MRCVHLNRQSRSPKPPVTSGAGNWALNVLSSVCRTRSFTPVLAPGRGSVPFPHRSESDSIAAKAVEGRDEGRRRGEDICRCSSTPERKKKKEVIDGEKKRKRRKKVKFQTHNTSESLRRGGTQGPQTNQIRRLDLLRRPDYCGSQNDSIKCPTRRAVYLP